MKCYNPTLAYINADHKRIFRSFNLANDIIKRNSVPFNCGKCLTCRKKSSLELARRCVLHSSLYHDNCFLTLTYNDASLDDNNLNYHHIQKFKKRLRKHVQNPKNGPNCYPGKKIEIFNVHEYGKNGRRHWHLIVFGHDFTDKEQHTIKNGLPLYTSKALDKLWSDPDTGQNYGFSTIGNVSEASALYQAQYTQKDIKNGNTNNAKKSKSNHSGIGKPYFLKHYKQILSLGYIPFADKKMPLPRYFEKLANKHYCHFYEQSAFFDNDYRKAKHRPFKEGEENKEIADLYIIYQNQKQLHIKEMEENWADEMDQHTLFNKKPEFVSTGENLLHDQKTKNFTSREKF